ncbi:serine/arginine repetitive matrix protein 2-like [Rhopalosiphum maidis]|uniref:serine/arginine repetitive matrix protein 2-like n=1 Tax=Rhopalosiphum maidis TaxID=43146 RepID=UPI000F0016CA|nr:serine/arginine repetitive matrix protein 2-like [Rhopalosiphum maidis]
MDGESTIDVDAGADNSRDIVTIPLLLTFDEPETVEPLIVDNDLSENETEPGPQQEPVEVSAMPSADMAVSTAVTAVRLGSGADDNPSTATAADNAEAENMDMRGRRIRSDSRGRRSRSRRSRSRRSRSRSSRSRNRRSRSRSRRGRSRRVRSPASDDSGDLTFVVEVGEDEVSTEMEAGGSRGGSRGGSSGGRKVARGGGRKTAKTAHNGRRVGKTAVARGGRVEKNQAARGGRKSAKRSRRGRKTTESMPRQTLWTGRLRSRNTHRQKKSQPK